MNKTLVFFTIVTCVGSTIALTQQPITTSIPTNSIPLSLSKCSGEIPYGVPRIVNSDSTFVCKTAYALQHDDKARIPIWVSYVLTPDHAVGCFTRSNAFTADIDLFPSKRSEPSDYNESGYDKGHIASDGDMSWDVNVERQSFYMSNMAPQLPGFNRGTWKKLEDQTRAWTQTKNHSLLIYAGPIYNSSDKTIANGKIIVPHGFYKIITDTTTNEVLVFRYNHEASSQPLNSFLTTIDKVSKETGINFPLPKNYTVMNNIWPTISKNVHAVKSAKCSVKI